MKEQIIELMPSTIEVTSSTTKQVVGMQTAYKIATGSLEKEELIKGLSGKESNEFRSLLRSVNNLLIVSGIGKIDNYKDFRDILALSYGVNSDDNEVSEEIVATNIVNYVVKMATSNSDVEKYPDKILRKSNTSIFY